MKKKSERKYRVQYENHHLMNILEDEYYVELGVIDFSVLKKFLKGERVKFFDLIDVELLTKGVGRISNDDASDASYQLNYLMNLKLKNSTSKYILTISTLKYIDTDGCEKYAPIFLVPFDLDIASKEIKKSDNGHINISLLQYIFDNNKELNKLDGKDNVIYEYRNKKITNVSDIDKISSELSKMIPSSVEPTSFFTIATIEYNDFDLAKNKLTPQHSLNEVLESEITRRYFSEAHSILPMNLPQKHILLKVKDGESFSVDGRLGTGKTHTIINIIADAIKNDKRVLYVNQDADNIYDIEKKINYLGLNNFTYNLDVNLKKIEPLDCEFDYVENELDTSVLDKVFNFQNQIQKRIHGYSIQTIFEEIAVLKHDYPNIEEIVVENELEAHEVSQVYEGLKVIEESLKHIDLYATNAWRRLQISQQSVVTGEIMSITNDFQKVQTELYLEVKKFCEKYQFELPYNINELYKLITYIYSFASVVPLNSWKNDEIREIVHQNLHDIQNFKDIHYTINKYYKNNINVSYANGRMAEIFNQIIGDHIKVDENFETDDVKYFNKLIAKNNTKKTLINEIENNMVKILKISKELKDIFNLNFINYDAHSAFIKLSNLLAGFKMNRKIIDCYLSSSNLFIRNASEIYSNFEVYKKMKEILPKYVNRFELFTTNFLNEIFFKKNRYKALVQLVNSKAIKQDHIDVNVIISEVEQYHNSMENIQRLLSQMFGNNDYDETFINQVIIFYEFIDSLNLKQMEYFKYFLDKLSVQRSHETYIKKVKTALDAYKDEAIVANNICKKLEEFNIIIPTNDLTRQIELLYIWKMYLIEVDKLKDEMYQIFKKDVSYEKVIELIKTDEKYSSLINDMKKRDNEFERNLGKYYQGLNTSVNDIGQTLEHYGIIIKKVKDPQFLEQTLQNKLTSLLDDARQIEKLYFTWGSKFRAFSFCFKGGQPEFPLNSFVKNNKLLALFVDKQSQIDDILKINELTDEFLEFGLKDLHEGIRSCKYGVNIANRFLYTMYNKYYKDALREYPLLVSFDEIKQHIKIFKEFETAYCNKNLQLLQLKAKEVESAGIEAYDLAFNDYNNIVKNLKTINLFYANLGIFNGNLDLSLFDLVIIDDAHLSSANKYNRLNECKQVIAFGNSQFHTSVSNTLMTRIGSTYKYELSRSYFKKNSSLNPIDKSNQYIYSYRDNISIVVKDDFNAFVLDMLNRFLDSPTHIYNILVSNEISRRKIYTLMVNALSAFYEFSEIMEIFSYNIRILNAPVEGNRYVNEVFLYFDDFLNVENSIKDLTFKNFLVANDNVIIYLIKHKIETENKEIFDSVEDMIKRKDIEKSFISPIAYRVKKAITARSLEVENGLGSFDLIIKAKKPVAVYIIGKANTYMSNFVDEFIYYYHEYIKHGWDVEIIYLVDLIENFEGTINKIVEKMK